MSDLTGEELHALGAALRSVDYALFLISPPPGLGPQQPSQSRGRLLARVLIAKTALDDAIRVADSGMDEPGEL